MIRILRLIRAVKIQKTFKQLTENIHINAEISSIFKFIKLTFIVALVAHYIACIYNFVLTQEIDALRITDPEIIDRTWSEKYIISM